LLPASYIDAHRYDGAGIERASATDVSVHGSSRATSGSSATSDDTRAV
jgi:hypothetical protein